MKEREEVNGSGSKAGKEEDLKVLKVVGRYNGMCDDNALNELLEHFTKTP